VGSVAQHTGTWKMSDFEQHRAGISGKPQGKYAPAPRHFIFSPSFIPGQPALRILRGDFHLKGGVPDLVTRRKPIGLAIIFIR